MTGYVTLTLKEVLKENRRAVHLGGRYVIDGPEVLRRFITIKVAASYGIEGDDQDVRIDVDRHPKPPKDFPTQGWILLEE